MNADGASRPSCAVSVLRTVGDGRATKRFKWHPTSQAWLKTAYSMGKQFIATRHEVRSVQDLGTLVETTRRDPRAFIIRGELAEGRDYSKPVFRRYLQRAGKTEPDFVDVPRSWLMADIDGWAIPDGLDLADDTDVVIERAIGELLPVEFHDVTAFWQLSSSAGFSKGTLKVHVWFYLDRAIPTLVLKQWMGLHAHGIDQALFNAVQIHYCADPVIEGGADPVNRRTGWVQGQYDVVTLPLLDAKGMARESCNKRRSGAAAAGLSPSQAATLDGALSALGDGDGLAGFHIPLRRAAWLYASKTPPWQRDLAAIKGRMTAAILAAPVDSHKRDNVSSYLTDAYLDAVILSAFEKIPDGGGWEACMPEHKPRTDDVTECRRQMGTSIREFLTRPYRPASLAQALNPDMKPEPRRGLVVAEVGLGKTEATLQEIVVFIEREKAAARPFRTLYTVPEHRLGTELISRAEMLGISVATWRGRHYVDPITATAMCDDLPAVKLAEEAGARVDKFVCGKLAGKDKNRCSKFFGCQFQAQKPRAEEADLVIAAHTIMFNELPAEISGDLGLVVIDESFWQSALRQTSISVQTFSADPLEHPVFYREPDGTQRRHDGRTNDLHSIRAQVQRALEASPFGYIQRSHMEAAGLTADLCAEAGKLEWERQCDIPMYPGMPLAERREAGRLIAINAQIPRMHMFWTFLRELLEGALPTTGRIELQQVERKNGSQTVSLLNTRKPLSKAILAVPVLMLDGTADIAIVRHFLPDVELLAEERPAQPHMTVHQVVGALSKTSLSKRDELVNELRDFIALTSRGEPTLIVTHLDLEPAFEGMPNVQVAHFGAIAGRDEWKDVRHLFLLGRPQPSPNDTRAMAAQLTGKPVPLADPVRATRGVLMTDGRGVAIEVSRFDDPDLEAIRAAVTDAAIVQAGGRGRGCNRTADRPLDLWVMGNVITPWPVTDVSNWPDLALNPVVRMLARGALLTNASDAAKGYDDLFVSSDAARKAFQRAGLKGEEWDISLLYTLNKGMSHSSFQKVSYRPAGAGQKKRRAFVADYRLDVFREWLGTMLGDLAVYTVGDQPDPPPNAPRAERPKEPQPPPEPDLVADIPVWAADDPGWSPDAWATANPDHFEVEEPVMTEQEHKMQFSDQDEILLDPGAAYAKMPVGVVLVEPITNMVRLPIGLASCAARRGDRRLVDELRALVPPGRLGIGLLLGRPELSG